MTYAWPVADADSVAHTLCIQGKRASRVLGSRAPSPTLISKVVEDFALSFPTLSFESPAFTYENYVREVYQLNWDSTPGLPLSSYGTTNRQLFQVSDGRPSESRLLLVYQFLQNRVRELEQGLALDPIKVFVKQEPVKLKKLQEGRQRLIFGVSVVDNLLAGIFFRPWFEKLLNWHQLPFQFGCAIQMGGYRRIALRLYGLRVVSADKSSWDWTVAPWEISAFEKLMSLWCTNYDLLRKRVILSVFSPGRRLQLSKDATVRLTMSGIMPSGTFFTISVNSILQVLVHRVACAELGVSYSDPLSCGDDTVQEDPDDEEYWKKWEEYGHVIKERHVSLPCQPFEFMGHLMSPSSCRPVYVDKHAFILQHLSTNPDERAEVLSSYAHLYAAVPCKSEVLRRRLVGTPYYVLPGQLRAWYHGWESH